MFIFYFPLRINQLIRINLLGFLDSDKSFVRQSLWVRILIYRLMWALSSLGASGPGWGEVWAQSLLLWGCGLWACLVGSRGPWVGSLKLWWYSRWRSGLQLHHCLPGHLWGLPGVLSQTLTSHLSQATSLPWPCLFSLSVACGGSSGLTLWKPDRCGLCCQLAVAQSLLCNGVFKAHRARDHWVPAQPWAPFLREGVFPSILLWLHSHLLFLPLFFSPSVISLFFHLSLNIFLLISLFSLHFPLYSPSFLYCYKL